MTRYLRRDTDAPELEDDQAAVVQQYHEGSGRVAVGAGAGTGKTTTLMDVVAEAVLQELFAQVPDSESVPSWLETADQSSFENPFDDVLLTTFSNDAANELKTRLKRRLRDHNAAAEYELPVNVWSWIETGSTISTIDSFFHELFEEIAVEIGVAPSFEVQSKLELRTLRDDVMAELEREHQEKVRRLENAYPAESWREYPPADLGTMLADAQQRCREYCVEPLAAADGLLENLNRAHADVTPPYDLADINTMVSELVQEGAVVTPPDEDAGEQLVEHVEETYERSRQLASDFGDLLVEYDRLYDERTREEGQFSHQDITYHLYSFLRDNPVHPFTEALRTRYSHVFVDEFQDTSYAQTAVLSEFISDEEFPTKYLLIGDVKQSIYEWRSAEPGIFARLLDYAKGEPVSEELPLMADELTYQPLTSNFRSHPHIIGAVNEIFGDIFDQPGRGAMGDVPIDYTPLDAKRRATQADDPHVHVMNRGGETKTEHWVDQEIEQAADAVTGILDEGSVHVDRDPFSEDMTLTEPVAGDITFLFRRRRFMRQYAEELRDRGIGVAVNLDDDLFSQAEVRLIIDLLNWFANPHSKSSLLRIVRSPLVALSDATIRALTSHESSIPDLLNEWDSALPDDDRKRLRGLVTLRDDLRWEREGNKTELIHRIYRHSGFDTVVLADTDALRRYGNLWLLAEVVSQWEDEELLAYREFVDRLQRHRDQSESSAESDYTVVNLADESEADTVTLTTIHAAKGREFPIVFVVDLLYRLNYPRPQLDRLLSTRAEGFTLRPRAAETPCPTNCSIPSPDEDAAVWLSEAFDEDFADCTGPIWLSDERDPETGELRYNNPLNTYIQPQIAESWRMLYVALTRATDHLFVGLGEAIPYRGEWTTWMVGIRESLSEDGSWPAGLSRELLTTPSEQAADSRVETVPIGVDDVAGSDREPTAAPDTTGVDVYLDSDGPTDRLETIPFRPETITPTSVHTLAECPRRYQYQHVQQITDIRASGRSELSPPGGMDPAAWGTLVHETVERHIQSGKEAALEHVRSNAEAVQAAVEHGILSTFESTTVHDQVENYCSENEVLTEHELRAFIPVDGREVQVRGQVDLLYRIGEEWHIVDFKTASAGDVGAYTRREHDRQVATYVWLLEEIYGVDVASQTVLYLGDGVERSHNADSETFVSLVEDVATRVDFDEGGELVARPSTGDADAELHPDSRCGTCPYSAARGGPCEHGGQRERR